MLQEEQEFLNKYNNKEYISSYLYKTLKDNKSNIIPSNFNIDNYNNEILDKLYIDNKEYFDNMYKGIDDNVHLDEEQCKAILAEEKYSLIIAGAGTGKTTTMASKVKYLVDKKHINPERILVMSYTKKATEEIAKRIIEDFDIDVRVSTFHSLGYEYIKRYFKDKKCDIVDYNKLNEISLDYFRKIYINKENIYEILENFQVLREMKDKFIFSNFFINNFMDFDTYDEFVDYYVIRKINEAKSSGLSLIIKTWIEKQLLKAENIISIKGDIVKSAGEMIIANFLFKHGVDYNYEKVYKELMENKRLYHPDFTIDYGGEEIYIEYFGLDDKNYNNIKNKKIKYHQEHDNKFIIIDRLPLEKIEETIDLELKKYNIRYKEKSNEEIYEQILRLNPLSQVYPFTNYLYKCIETRKESVDRNNDEKVREFLNSIENEVERNQLIIQNKYIDDFYKYYEKRLREGEVYYFDYSDLLYYSNEYFEKITTDKELEFDYIIIDEYQDISKSKYDLTYKTAQKNNACVYAVGDDWQTIYSFSGSRIEYIYDFNKYFKGSKDFKITTTYRNSQDLVNYSGKFILENVNQISKELKSNNRIDKPILFVPFNDEEENGEINELKKLISEIHKYYKSHNILILGRKNSTIEKLYNDKELKDDIGTKITYLRDKTIDIEGMTMHKSKGLTFDEVILVGMDKDFPITGSYNTWYENIYKNKPREESIEYPEERRLFYVALTRTKNRVFILQNNNPKKVSDFVLELDKIIKSFKE